MVPGGIARRRRSRPARSPGVPGRPHRVCARALAEPFERPAGFELAAFWRQWSAEFEASRPRLPVTLRASPRALSILGEVFGQAAGPALAAALPPDEHGWRVLTLSFEHERAAVHRLAGFADQVEVLAPPWSGPGWWPRPARSWDATMRQSPDWRGHGRRTASRWTGPPYAPES